MFGLSPLELLVILGIAVFAFGAKKLPDIGKALGRMGSEFTEGKKEALGEKDDKEDKNTKAEQSSEAEAEAEEGFKLEDELKAQVFNRLPGLGKINRLKKTVETATRVAEAITKNKPSGKS